MFEQRIPRPAILLSLSSRDLRADGKDLRAGRKWKIKTTWGRATCGNYNFPLFYFFLERFRFWATLAGELRANFFYK